MTSHPPIQQRPSSARASVLKSSGTSPTTRIGSCMRSPFSRRSAIHWRTRRAAHGLSLIHI
eukprot:10880396-Alexandrium_andersonii.AAC.1